MSADLLARAQDILSRAGTEGVRGKVVVIKVGGASIADETVLAHLAEDLVVLKLMGTKPVVVHGGGPDITARMKAAGLPVEFVRGLRVTSEEAIRIVREVLVDTNNRALVEAINAHGDHAVGLSGDRDNLVRAKVLDPALGRVGDVTGVDADALARILGEGRIPVIACLGTGEDGGSLNINADLVAAELARAIRGEIVLFLTDVDGLYRNFPNKDSIIAELPVEEAERLLASGALGAGMAPKIDACVRVIRAGAERARIVNAKRAGALLSEFEPSAITGTRVVAKATGELKISTEKGAN